MSLLELQPELAFCSSVDFGDVTSAAEYAERVKTAGAQAIDRILKAVGKEHVPHDLDRRSLCRDIADAYYSRDRAFDLAGGSKSQARLKHLKEIRQTAKKLTSLLRGEPAIGAMIKWALERTGIIMPSYPMLQPLTLVSFLEQLESAIAKIENSQKHVREKWRSAHKTDSILRGRRLTEKDWLAGVSLPLVFERHFHERAARSRDKAGESSGPMVRFIGVTMKELGLPYSNESIARAYSLRAPLREQRRRGDNILTEIRRQV